MRIILGFLFWFIVDLAFAQSATLVLPGDHPDPSVVKINNGYWASATTSNWAPVFPIIYSKDLIDWETKAFVFKQLPAWADYYFWAPEISYDNGKVYVYYSAHKRDGNLCIGVASADKPEGPYTDHGPLMCEEAGSIDAFPMRDKNGKLYLIWKEDGNSIKQPTNIWAMAMNEERTELFGEKKKLFRDDAGWEYNLVEGVSMMQHGEYYYAFYAGAGCCGRECTYAMGIARAKNLLGPWEKYEKNPIFNSDANWRCPGHGTPVEKDGRHYILYHAYHAKGDVYAGRQGILKEFTFTPDGWIKLVDEEPSIAIELPHIKDGFSDTTLSHKWQWSVFQTIDYKIEDEKLQLHAMAEPSGAFIGQKIYTSDYQASVTVFPQQSNAAAGLSLVGDEKNMISVSIQNNVLSVWKLKNNVHTLLNETKLDKTQTVYLQLHVQNGDELSIKYSVNGKDFKSAYDQVIDAHYLPPWDRAVRVALIAKGKPSQHAVFDDFELKSFEE